MYVNRGKEPTRNQVGLTLHLEIFVKLQIWGDLLWITSLKVKITGKRPIKNQDWDAGLKKSTIFVWRSICFFLWCVPNMKDSILDIANDIKASLLIYIKQQCHAKFSFIRVMFESIAVLKVFLTCATFSSLLSFFSIHVPKPSDRHLSTHDCRISEVQQRWCHKIIITFDNFIHFSIATITLKNPILEKHE